MKNTRKGNSRTDPGSPSTVCPWTNQKNPGEAAIQKDGLVWENHVSDLKGWDSEPAARYGIMAIPMNFLIDGSGIIVAKGLRGEYLEDKLKEMVK
ncbi:MAG: hypothetical protein R2751_06580 [Bacteroidales bacterium]